jgi:uridine monophosphate synthetase
MSFFSKLEGAIEANQSLLCVGLDPQLESLKGITDPVVIEEELVAWGSRIIEATKTVVCCYKPNFAFYEQHGLAGLKALQRTVAMIPDTIPHLLDVKRGDIGSTAQAYADAAYNQWHADAVTVSPYLGEDSIKPFLKSAGKAAFVLCHTSNPSAAEIQHHGQPALYEFIAETSKSWGNSDQIGFVVGATQPEAMLAIRDRCPEHWILAPGVGAQGGDLEATLNAGLRADGKGLILPVSRAVIAAADPQQAASELRDQINGLRKKSTPKPPALSPKEKLVARLFETGCIKFGQFTLASGKLSPIYVDLRRIISFPDLFAMAVDGYTKALVAISYDLLAGVPYAALPATAVVAAKLQKPMIYPRKEIKQHGTGQAIEGAYSIGQTAVMLEDVVTSGGSIVKAAATLQEAGLRVTDVVVLVDREQGGREELQRSAGIHLHAVVTIHEVLTTLKALKLIDNTTYSEVWAYLEQG